MSHQTETHYCSACDADTSHVLVLVRKESPFKEAKNRKTKEFLAGVLKGWALGPFIASMDEFERHLICEKCGNKIIED